MKGYILCLALIAVACSATNCSKKNKSPELIKKDVDVTIPGNFEPVSTLVFSTKTATTFFAKYPKLTNIKADWEKFYTTRNYSFAWFDTAGITAAGQNLHNRINNLNDPELDSSLFYRAEFNALFDSASTEKFAVANPLIIEAEMMLSAQYFMYAQKMYATLDDSTLKKLNWNMARKKLSYNEYLNNAITSGNDLFENEPIYEQYGLLREWLIKYQDLAIKKSLPKIDTTLAQFQQGDTSENLIALKKYLAITEDGAMDSTALFDTTLTISLRTYQTRNGIKPTGKIDKATLADLNEPISNKIQKVLVNMERCKWVPQMLGEDYIWVNIPEYRMHVIEKRKNVWDMDVVVGKTATKTVIFNDTLQTVAFSPYWYPPASIIKGEMGGRPSANYLRRNNMEYSGGSLRQRPGGNNALGKVKFLFPNSYNIYFHDTPAKDKFSQNDRAFSHGCIRLSEPKKLAEYLLRDEPKYTSQKMDSLMSLTREYRVTLKKPLPVFIAYLTAFVNKKTGKLEFRKDIYGHDKQVVAALFAKK
jgi:L,D-transpeptidase YcbB